MGFEKAAQDHKFLYLAFSPGSVEEHKYSRTRLARIFPLYSILEAAAATSTDWTSYKYSF